MAKILIIDDDKSILRLLEFTLQRAGHRVETCTDSVEGLAQAEANQPDLIVVDVMMPKLNGYDFCKQARAKAPLEETPIIMFSARFQAIDKATALQAGATDYLSKTTSPNDLVKRIAELLPAHPSAIGNTAIGLFSLRGGTGSTSLAVNLAVAAALTKKSRALLIDLARLGGHAALMLGLRPNSSVVQALATAKNNLTPDAIRPHLMQHKSGAQLLASAHGYDYELRLTDKGLEQLIALLKSDFPYTILDMPHVLEPGFAPSLQLFDKIVVVLSPDMPSLQSTAMALQGLARLGITEGKIALVTNQVIPSGALPSETIQKVLKRPILANIPFDPEMIKAVNSSNPLFMNQPQSPAARAIAQLATMLFN